MLQKRGQSTFRDPLVAEEESLKVGSGAISDLKGIASTFMISAFRGGEKVKISFKVAVATVATR